MEEVLAVVIVVDEDEGGWDNDSGVVVAIRIVVGNLVVRLIVVGS